MDRPTGAWNVVVTAQEGAARSLRRALRPIVELEWSAFRNVALAWVPDRTVFLDAVAALRAERPRLDEWLGRVVPVDVTFTVDPPRILAQLEQIVAPWLPKFAGATFHVRVARRGHKGVLDSHGVEQALGGRIVDLMQVRGEPVRVAFRDPDLIVHVEILGEVGGVVLVPRALRERYSFLRVA
jgi:tRNA(Ser,Leu) C12 N-acetylase TAN1